MPRLRGEEDSAKAAFRVDRVASAVSPRSTGRIMNFTWSEGAG
jgi:hypothetical protein